MKHFYFFFILCIYTSSTHAQSCFTAGCVSVYGSGTGFEQANLNTLFPTTAQAGVKDIEVFAWTANSAGVPSFNGRTAMKFNFSAIPAGAIITSAKMYLQGKTDNAIRPGQGTYTTVDNTSLIQKITNNWTENTATWTNQPAVTTTGQKTLQKSTVDNQNYVVDITDFVQSWTSSPATNYGLLMRIQTEQPYSCMMFYGGNATTITNRVRVDVCYAPPAGNSSSNLTIFGNKTGKFTNVIINNNYPLRGFARYPEVVAVAWTNNAEGFPVFNDRALLRYDVSAIPASSTINSAKLYLFAKQNPLNGNKADPTFGTANTSLLQKITQNWDTTGTTTGWSNQPTVNTATQKTLLQSASTRQNYEVDVTDFVQQWVNRPDSNFGMLLRIKVEQIYNSMIFENDLNAADAIQPRLEICYNAPPVLPLTLANFTGTLNGSSIRLYWNTLNERNASLTEIQTSLDGNIFAQIGALAAKNLGGTNAYQFSYNNAGNAFSKVYYRLKFVNKDGSFTYSNVLVFASRQNANIALLPNPAKGSSQLSLTLQQSQVVTIKILDMAGHIMTSQKSVLLKGRNTLLLNNIWGLSKGPYFVTANYDGMQSTVQLQVQ